MIVPKCPHKACRCKGIQHQELKMKLGILILKLSTGGRDALAGYMENSDMDRKTFAWLGHESCLALLQARLL